MFGKRIWCLAICLVFGVAALVLLPWDTVDPPLSFQVRVDDLHPVVGKAISNAITDTESDPKSIEKWELLGKILLAHGRSVKAAVCFEYLCRREPDNPRWWYYQGFAFDGTNLQKALNCYAKAAELAPGNGPLAVRYGRLLSRSGRPPQALRILKTALEQNPKNPWIELELAILHSALGDTDQAIELCRSATERKGWYSRPALAELARLLYRNGSISEASVAYQRLILMPEATAEIPDKWLQEVQVYDQLKKTSAAALDLQFASGQVWLAAQGYEALCKRRPELLRPRINLAQAYAQLGETAKGLSTLQEAVERFPDRPSAWFALGQYLHLVGQSTEAVQAYRRCTAHSSVDPAPWLNLGMALSDSGQQEEAVAAFRKAISLDPQSPHAWFSLGLVFEKDGQLPDAVDAVRKAKELSAGDPIPAGKLKELLEKSG